MLRLARFGKKKKPYYRIVATDKASKRDGRYLEVVGSYNPTVIPPQLVLKQDRVKVWIEQGAQPSKLVRDFIRKEIPNYIEEREKSQRNKIQARRKARKARSPKKEKKASPKKNSKAKS